MAGKATDLSGVKGFLSDFQRLDRPPHTRPVQVEELPAKAESVSEDLEAVEPKKESVAKPVEFEKTDSAKKTKRANSKVESVRARTGRPPGRKVGEGPLRVKATFHVEANLMNNYRDWSWDERCNVGELVERALADYWQRERGGATSQGE